MKVLYDVSVLGLGELDSRARTGVFRAVESVAEGLAGVPECELSFCAGGASFHAVYGVLRYLGRHPEYAGVPFRSAGAEERARARALDRSVAGMEANGSGPVARLRRWSSSRRAVELARPPHPIGRSLLEATEIYHSPHGPLPRPEPGIRARRFLTVYDLIAVKQPELFEPHVPAYTREILRSIGPQDWVICISDATRGDLLEAVDLAPERVFVVPLAASRELFQAVDDPEIRTRIRERRGIPAAPYFLSLNTLEPRKNVDSVIRAFSRLVESGRAGETNLVLVGTRGWHYEAIFEAAERAGGVRDRIVFTGYVPDEELAVLYSGAAGFVYPSLYEGFGLPVLEAMQCGIPVITSDSSSLPEVVGDAGRMVPARDVDALEEAMAELLEDPGLRAERGARSLARASTFSWERCTRETLAAYRTALDA